MSIAAFTTTICLIACHGGPADHFATYAQTLKQKGYHVQVYATGPAVDKFKEVDYHFDLTNCSEHQEDDLAQYLAKICLPASVVITDIGHPFDIKIQKALSLYASDVPRVAYYDNPEPFVPGGYSTTASKVIEIAQGILFANTSLMTKNLYQEKEQLIDLEEKKKMTTGFYPLDQAKKIKEQRKNNHETLRSAFLKEKGIDHQNKKALVYFGGNNDEYFSKAFPAFLSFIEQASTQIDLKDFVFVIHQHPGAKQKNQESQQIETWLKNFPKEANKPTLFLSNYSSDQAQVLADCAFYYQTSMNLQFALAGLATVQIGHQTYEDSLVKNRLAPSVTCTKELIYVLKNFQEQKNILEDESVLIKLGIAKNWEERLNQSIKQMIVD